MSVPRHPDPRIAIHEGGGTAADAYLLEGDTTAPPGSYAVRFNLLQTGHSAGCACCAPRGSAATALAAMFRARATGAAPFFSRVILLASPAGTRAVHGAIDTDAFAAARYMFWTEDL